ncbi:MAG TPA: adenylate/guanylate cyclase domain-containing protein [Actinomycetota bacterium]|nr:adenylate/guanylate cyclase domain-containing protein [Actinomycetota bacterium]
MERADQTERMAVLETHYARSADVHVAYQVLGTGPPDLIFVGGFLSHLDHLWEEPRVARFFERLASFSRLILFDKRGSGLSDPVHEAPTLETRIEDVRVVMDAIGSEQAAVFGVSEGGPMSMLFAATQPNRVSSLVLWGTWPRFRPDPPDYPWGIELSDEALDALLGVWGDGATVELFAPSRSGDESFRRWWARLERLSGSPSMIREVCELNRELDCREILPTISSPTLVMQRREDPFSDVDASHYLADRIPASRLLVLDGRDHFPWTSDVDRVVEEVAEFVTGSKPAAEVDRILATVLFTDIVASTEHAARSGDREWRALLDAHHAAVRRELQRFRGTEVVTRGDGFLATFDGPARAVRCARQIVEEVRRLGLAVRAGLHTGEVELKDDGDIAGIAVHIGARIADLAGPGEVLVSSTIPDLVAGSGLAFEDRGRHPLKGVPGEWRVFAVTS